MPPPGTNSTTIVTDPLKAGVGAVGQAEEISVSSVEKAEPVLHDPYLPHLRDEKAARFAIACFLAQQ
jgi:hypothetical protein